MYIYIYIYMCICTRPHNQLHLGKHELLKINACVHTHDTYIYMLHITPIYIHDIYLQIYIMYIYRYIFNNICTCKCVFTSIYM